MEVYALLAIVDADENETLCGIFHTVEEARTAKAELTGLYRRGFLIQRVTMGEYDSGILNYVD